MKSLRETNAIAPPRQQRLLRWSGVLFAMIFPSIVTWIYFVSAGQLSAGLQQAIYLAVKVIQFTFPVAWVAFILREPLRTGQATVRGVLTGVAFGCLVAGAGIALFETVLREAEFFSKAAQLIREKILGFGIDAVWKYAILGIFYSVCHSLLEEYYWRWFVFRQLRQLMFPWLAIGISAIAFATHHVIVLSQYFGGAWWIVGLFSAAVACGGAFWAWIYDRTNSLLATWVSHLAIDAGIFWIGYELVRAEL